MQRGGPGFESQYPDQLPFYMLWNKILVLVLIALGEGLMILAQIYGARASLTSSVFWTSLRPDAWYVWATFGGALSVLSGYFYGITVWRNIWLVTLTSWTAIVLIEIILAWLVFRTPLQGSVLAGFILVLIGFVLANL